MKNIISFLVILTTLISCSGKVEVSPSLKEAWNIVNRDQDIYHRHLILSEEIAKIDKSLAENLDSEEVAQLISQKNEILSEMTQEEKRIIQVQSTVEQASDKQILYLASL